jgi:hypothetical protein
MPSTAAFLSAATLAAMAPLGTVDAASAAASDDPRKCFVITGPGGEPLNTTCVPWPLPTTS